MLKLDERLDRLMREGIDIIQSKSVFSFSLDAVLLAYFAHVPRRKKALILDACSGNGAVAFMLSAKTNNKIYAIEYQERLADMAKRSIVLNHLENRVEMLHSDYKEAHHLFKPNSVDVITCNPPYFPKQDNALLNEREHYAIARHEVMISLQEWVAQSATLLKVGGKCYCVHRPERLLEIISVMSKHQLIPKRIQFVHPKKHKEANIVLIEAVKNGKLAGLKVLEPIIVYGQNNEYTPFVEEVLYGR